MMQNTRLNVSDLADSQQVYQLQKRLQDAADKLAALVPQVGKARQIIEFASDQRKRALAKAMTPYLDGGESASSAEAKARASFNYGEEMLVLAKALTKAEQTKAEWEALKVAWESSRSLLSMEKELSRL
jgi:hypothetical protein